MLNNEDKETISFIQYINLMQNTNYKGDIAKQIPDLNWENVYYVLKKHAILTFPANIVSKLPHIDEKTLNMWKKDILMIVSRNTQIQNAQDLIIEAFMEERIRMIVVKGTSAAQYYPNPFLRTLGDIDLLVHPDDFDKACMKIMKIGADEITTEEEKKFGRHRVFAIHSFVVELHRFIASVPGTEEAKTINQLAYKCTEKDSLYADDLINGIILLDHIKKHLIGSGIGLRQIIDWQMFVEKCLDDETWNLSFEPLAQKTGLKTLAIIITGLCSRYLGLSEKITWSNTADSSLIDGLLMFVMDCGNFGVFRDEIDKWSFGNIPNIWQIKNFFSYLQEQGIRNWHFAKKHTYLKCFAWLYEIIRLLHHGINKKITPSVLRRKMNREKRIRKMMKNLEIM